MRSLHDDLPEELQGCCAFFLDITSAGRFGQASQASRQLLDKRLVDEKAARQRAVIEKISSRSAALAATCRAADESNLITFSDGGAKFFKCTCTPDKEFAVGRGYSNMTRHLASRTHFKHWRLAAFGEADDAEAWLVFAAKVRSLPGVSPARARVRL